MGASEPVKPPPSDRIVSLGAGKYLLILGGPLLLGLCGFAGGIFVGAIVAGLVHHSSEFVSGFPGLDPASFQTHADVAHFVRFVFAGIGLVVGLVFGLHALVTVRALASARVPTALLLFTCFLTLVAFVGVAWVSSTLLENLLAEVFARAGGNRGAVMKILDWEFVPGGDREENVMFCRVLGSIIAGMFAVLLCSNTFFVISVGNRVKRALSRKSPAVPKPPESPSILP